MMYKIWYKISALHSHIKHIEWEIITFSLEKEKVDEEMLKSKLVKGT